MANGPNRRGLVVAALATVGAAAAAASPAITPDANPDAELIRLCAEHDALDRELFALTNVSTIEEENRVEAAADALGEKQMRIANQIGALPPTTPAGWRALAATIVLTFPEMARDEQDGHDDLLIATLLEGLLGRGEIAA